MAKIAECTLWVIAAFIVAAAVVGGLYFTFIKPDTKAMMGSGIGLPFAVLAAMAAGKLRGS